MKMKKLLAGSLAAVFAGGLLAAGGMATLGDYVTTSGGDTLASPIIVVGDSVPGSDVIGAADLAAAVAGFATTTTTVSGVGTTTVSGGVALDTQNSKLYYADAMNSSITTLTSADLPTVLKSGTFQDDDGTEYKYDQYIVLGSRVTEFGNSGGDIEDPTTYVNIGTTVNSFLYATKVVFNKPLLFDASETQGNTIEFFGKEYTITSGTTSVGTKTLVLFDSSNALTFTEGEAQEVTIGEETYTITLEGVSSTTVGVIQVTNSAGISKSKEVTEGNSYKVNGISVVAEDIFYFGDNKINKASLSFGSGKMTFADTNEVKVGTELEPIDNTYVQFTGNISTFEVWVAADDSERDHAGVGTPFTDTVWGSFKTAFGGFNPGLGADTNQKIVFGTSGDKTATVKFTDYRGYEKTVEYAWDTDSVSSTVTPALNSSDNYQIHVVEGEAIIEKDYFVLSQGDFGHLFQLSDISNVNSTTARVDIRDVFSGETTTINLDSTPPGYTKATVYIDGNTYYLNATAKEIKFTWGAAASHGTTGTQTTVYPFLKGQSGYDVAFLTSATGFANNTIVYLPGGNTETGATQGMTAINFTPATGNATYNAGRLYWNVTRSGTGVATIWGVGDDAAGVNSDVVISPSTIGATNGQAPAVLILEEKGKDSSSTEVRDAIIVPTSTSGTSTVKMAQGTPVFTAATQANQAWKSDTDVTSYMDRYGTLANRDSGDQGVVTVYYPDVQSVAAVAIGANPSFSTEVGGTTVETAIKIQNPVAKFAKEISTSTLSKDLILVGGPCANALVATLAETDTDIPACDDWDLTTGIIKEVSDAFGSGQKALVVAGTTAADTRSLAGMVMKGTLDYLV